VKLDGMSFPSAWLIRIELMDRYLDPDPELILEDVNEKTNPKYHALNRAVAGLVSDLTGNGLTCRLKIKI